METSTRSLLWFFLTIVVLFVIFIAGAFYSFGSLFSTDVSDADRKANIGVIEISGPIFDSKKIIDLIHLSQKDEDIKAVILRIDSPGGAVGPVQEVYQEVKRINDKYIADRKKKGKAIYASFGTIAASGGYYIGSASMKIYANPGSLIGSIGVIMHFFDASKFFEKLLLFSMNIKSGRYKDSGSPFKSMSKEEQTIFQKIVDTVHKQFIRDVMQVRKGRIRANIDEISQGQIFSGEEAIKIGLVDRLGGLWQAVREIHRELKLKGEPKIKIIKKDKRINFVKILRGIDSLISWLEPMVKNHWTPAIFPKFSIWNY